MVNFYVKMILNGKMMLADVPERWYNLVEEALNNGN